MSLTTKKYRNPDSSEVGAVDETHPTEATCGDRETTPLTNVRQVRRLAGSSRQIMHDENSGMRPVINSRMDALDRLHQMGGRAMAAWTQAILQLDPKPGIQVVTIEDQKAAEQLMRGNLIRRRVYGGREIVGRYFVPRSVAFCSLVPDIPVEDAFCPELVIE